jgi:hypothetical protein
VDDSAFSLALAEKAEVVTNRDHLARLRFSPVLPRALAEHGAIMAANVDVLQRTMKILDPHEPPPPEIGFHAKEDAVSYRTKRKVTS